MSGFGGARKGAGRKPGTLNVLTREIATKAAAEGITPLEVMLKYMRELDGVLSAMDPEKPETCVVTYGHGKHAVTVSRMELIDRVMEHAVKAAPFMHARLASLVVKPPGGDDNPSLVAPVLNVSITHDVQVQDVAPKE